MKVEKLNYYKKKLHEILHNNIIPFWYPYTLDQENGGFFSNHDGQGEFQGQHNKGLVSQSRIVWFFSYLAGSKYGRPEHLEAARHGFRFLADHFWDKEFSGFFWEVDATGNEATMPDKHILGQAFGLFALSEFARVSNDLEARSLAKQIFFLIHQKAYDHESGGYREFLKKDWTRISDECETYMRSSASIKTLNTHLHLLEAFIEYYRLSKEPMARERLLELILIQSNSVVRKNIAACTNLFHMDWTLCKGKLAERVTYGHDLENIWLLIEACRVVGIQLMPLAAFFKENFQYTLKYGHDNRRGGLYDHGKLKRKANARHKVWWPQAETLVCALEMYRLFNEDIYLKCFDKTLNWILNYQIDWEKGEWHQRITPRGKKIGNKAELWKTPYHNGRAMIRCLNILEESHTEP